MNKNHIFKTGFIWLVTALLVISPVVTPVANPPPAAQATYLIQAGSAGQAVASVQFCGGAVTSSLEIIESAGARLALLQLECVESQPGVVSVTPNAPVQVVGKGDGTADAQVNQQAVKNQKIPATDYPDVTGADQVWTRTRDHTNGSGVTVAVVDTGIANHLGLVRDIQGKNDRIIGWVDLVSGTEQPTDPNGHGTHVAGVIANSQVGADNEWNGMAPGVDLVGVRVLGEDGSGTYEKVIQGIQWVVQHKAEYHIRVMNLSLVSPAQVSYWADPLDRAVTAAWAAGIVVVAAAGNDGPDAMTITVPGNNPYAITAGAYTDNYTPLDFTDDYLTPFSSAGPTLDGFTKPDVLAPGGHIVSTMLPGSYVDRQHSAYRVDSQYYSTAGTSQAAAVVSGVAALVISKNPGLTPNQVKYRILTSALPWMTRDPAEAVYSIWQQGYGRINAPDAVFADLRGEANAGMDIKSDLAGKKHYEGYSYYDKESSTFRLRGDYAKLTGNFVNWNGEYAPGTGGFGAWSGALGAWSGGFGAWSGGFGAWSGGFGAWSGGYTTWAGGSTAWTGSEPWFGRDNTQDRSVKNFKAGSPAESSSIISSSKWVEEQKKH